MRKTKKRSRFVECVCRRPSLVLLLLPAGLLASLYVASTEEGYEFEPRYPSLYGAYNVTEGLVDGYLVWNPRCQMLSKEPLDAAIRSYVKKEKFENCSNDIYLTSLVREENGSMVLFVDPAATALHPGLECCWSAILRPEKRLKSGKDKDVELSVVVKECQKFDGQTIVPGNIEAALVTCNSKTKNQASSASGKPIYKNVHPVLSTDKVRERWRRNDSQPTPPIQLSRKLSVLLLGIDSVSRLNFLRSAPSADKYLRETGWVRLDGYNKMADNTFPNLMAILTGQNQTEAYAICKPTVPYKLDQCPFLWHNFRNAGYVTAYGEDETTLSTFNYLKVGFMDPPTDYYLRPYILACEKLLKVKKRFGLKYCTGPETSFDRILDYALEFARSFLGLPYFGLFWTTSISHENANGLSSMDSRLLSKLKYLEREGVLNDSMVVFLSDHGMRWGPIRNTLVGWYEERLPFIYIWLPEWFRLERPDAYASLRANARRLTSPFDLYETLRDVVGLSGGKANPSSACPDCHSLLGPRPVPLQRGCSDAGISSHWCACTAFKPADPRDPIVENGAKAFLEHTESHLTGYKDKKGHRLCSKLRLKKIHHVDRAIDFANSTDLVFFYMLQVTPGDAKFEVTVRYHENETYTVSDHEVSRINPYASGAKCLDHGMKQYCHCVR
ncbi:uncharacterized protein LOC128894230 [Hylaeus anthracinus]|uniref:uncharacterized protein LOC128894230 n=1 Tax=Hylaeus anthracinus TaxID=313031 RepID=UPI0023B8CC22|nr:uncharacterized protein LOC128894230 [Hylaeus anthracinus]XP_054011814.1 uncharacterized protein LOC128894230 [Hylaeus anthracinus]